MSNILKGGQFLVKESSFHDVFIPEEFTEEQIMFRDSVRDFVANEISPILDRLDKMEEGLAVAKLEMAGEMGLLGTAIPEAYGGSAMDFNTNSIFSRTNGGCSWILRDSWRTYWYRHLTYIIFWYRSTKTKIPS